jgi:hypothetical protein
MDKKAQYSDQGKLTSFHYGSEEASKNNQFMSENDEQNITQEQISDVYAEGTIDFELNNRQQSSQTE